jgi:hypothetical protein
MKWRLGASDEKCPREPTRKKWLNLECPVAHKDSGSGECFDLPNQSIK